MFSKVWNRTLDALALFTLFGILASSLITAFVIATPEPAEAAYSNKNPCTISAAPRTPTQHDKIVSGTMYVDCASKLQPHHDRVATVTRIKKWKATRKQWMNYRAYANTEVWRKNKNFHTNHAFAVIRCDGEALYKVTTTVYTYRTGQLHHTPPSQLKTRSSTSRNLCVGTKPLPLDQVNNP